MFCEIFRIIKNLKRDALLSVDEASVLAVRLNTMYHSKCLHPGEILISVQQAGLL